jgi:hypothetical protein
MLKFAIQSNLAIVTVRKTCFLPRITTPNSHPFDLDIHLRLPTSTFGREACSRLLKGVVGRPRTFFRLPRFNRRWAHCIV